MGRTGSYATYEWDAETRLAAVDPSSPVNGNKKLVFDYDYMGRRVRKRVDPRAAGARWPAPGAAPELHYEE